MEAQSIQCYFFPYQKIKSPNPDRHPIVAV
uniref:Uncharacterized protein n=1 Tax=Siphoviridae sp. ctvuW5 TaxID=2825725 RepID=A0A8S5TXB3_9CAUD|nr:MAG TPA: hypothetical protein [Siphoviridae sp. ctvuW5]